MYIHEYRILSPWRPTTRFQLIASIHTIFLLVTEVGIGDAGPIITSVLPALTGFSVLIMYKYHVNINI